MRKIFCGFFLLVFVLVTASCSSRPREPRTMSSNTGYSAHSQQAATGAAHVSSEPMKIWINPIEYQLELDDSVGDNGYIEEVWPKDKSEGITTKVDYYSGLNANTNMLAAAVQFKDSNVTFDKLSPMAQRAILYIIKENGLDGFFVTMIDEFTGTLKQTQKSKKYKTKDGEVKQDVTRTTTLKTRIIVKGIALRLKYIGPVSPERADKVRQATHIYY
ncbi:hypothetical protein II898_03785 [bacterium]|nr:hypothetical protein [bacterium]